jgi:hypothetical protein
MDSKKQTTWVIEKNLWSVIEQLSMESEGI